MAMRRFPQHLARLTAVAAILVPAACGSDDDASDGSPADGDAATSQEAGSGTATTTSANGDGDSEPTDDDATGGDAGGVSMQSGTGTATAVINGETWSFVTADGAISVCTEAFGTLQAALPQVDEAGNLVDGSEINLIALQPGVDDDERRDVYVELFLSDGSAWVAGESGFADILDIELEPIDLRADGSRLEASVEVQKLYEPGTSAIADITVECGS